MRDLAETPSLPDARAIAGEPSAAGDPRVQELTAALAGRDSFIAAIGHELRNSVSPMLLLAEQLRVMAQDPTAPAMLASRAGMLTRNVRRLVATIDRVAEVAELRRGTLQFELTTVDLVEVVAEVCREAQREAAAGDVALMITAARPVNGSWDRGRLKQIVENLVSNAIRYGNGGRVELDVVDHGTSGELIVRDHGPGLAPAMLAYLFDPFGPLDIDRRRRTGGFGIGLWVVKTLCTAMQGSVTAENDARGGARFCVVLPRG